jgi:hypothetical protein
MRIRYEANIESCEDCLLYLEPKDGSMIHSCAYDGVEDTNEPIVIGSYASCNWLSMPYSIRPCPLSQSCKNCKHKVKMKNWLGLYTRLRCSMWGTEVKGNQAICEKFEELR